MIDAFGPLLFNVLKFLGFNKGKLTKLFGKERIDKMYQKEYWLSDIQKKAINDIVISKDSSTWVENFSSTKLTTTDWSKIRLETWEDMEKQFDEKTKGKYTDLMISGEYYKNMNVSIFKAWLKTYSKDTNINDVVTIETDSVTGKQSITGIKKDTEFKWAMKSILDNDATRTNIATANDSIQTSTVEDKVSTGYNEQGIKTTQVDTYLIDGQDDIARYLTASLFSNKDLSFVMTENKLNNGVVATIDETPIVEKKVTPTETLTFKDKQTDFTDGKLNTKGYEKTIHEVLDVAKSPKNLQIIRGTKTIDIEQKTIDWVLTYAEKWKDTRVIINTGDKIIEVPVDTLSDKRKTINTELAKAATITAQSDFEKKPSIEKEDTDVYLKELKNLSKLFTTEADYKELIWDTDNKKTLTDMVTPANIAHFKNMLTYRWLKQTKDDKDAIYGTTNMTLDTTLASKIDTAKQTYTVTATDKGIVITAKEGTTEKWTITIKNTAWKIYTERTEKKATV
jgi:hypothetical protein